MGSGVERWFGEDVRFQQEGQGVRLAACGKAGTSMYAPSLRALFEPR